MATFPSRAAFVLGAVLLCQGPLEAAPTVDAARLTTLAEAGDWEQIKAMGPGVVPALARLYEASVDAQRATIAYVFYQLGWPSREAKDVLMKDVRTQNQTLRLQVQWAIGRVSSDPDVLEALLDNMRNDPEPLFRDKAACALAYDQIHLSSAQKARLFEGLIVALDDPKPQVRQIALQALQILTGHTNGFSSGAAPDVRRLSVEAWQRWLDEFRSTI